MKEFLLNILNPKAGISSVQMFEFYYSIHRFSMRTIGIDELVEKYPNRVWTNTMLASLQLFGTTFLMMSITHALLTQNVPLAKVIEMLGVLFVVSNGLCKVCFVMYNRKVVIRQVKIWQNLWRATVSPEELSVLQGPAKKAKALKCLYLMSGATLILSYLFAPLINANNGITLPYIIGIKIDSNFTLICIYAVQFTFSWFCYVPVIGSDMIIPMFLYHACGHFKVLRFKMRNINKVWYRDGKLLDGQDQSAADYSHVESNLKACIRRHQVILQACLELEAHFNMMCLIQSVSYVYDVCVAGLGILLIPEEKYKFFVHIIAITWQLLMFCLPANDLMEESLKVANEAFGLPWYHCSHNVQLDTLMMITRAQKCCQWTAGKFYAMSLQTCTSLISNGASAFAVFREVL